MDGKAQKMGGRIIGTVLALLTLAAGAALASDDPSKARPLRILFIGNSLTLGNGMPNTFAALAANYGRHRVQVVEIAVGGASLKDHWEGKARKRLNEGWDYVVLQPKFDTTPDEYARMFHDEIAGSGAKTILFNTWARRGADPSRQRVLDQAFARSAVRMGAMRAPVGLAWEKFAAKHGARLLYEPDDFHPSLVGSYVAASVFYALVFGKPVPASDATGLTHSAHEAAWEAVRAAVR